jgi:Tfp pilus assembly protein PilF
LVVIVLSLGVGAPAIAAPFVPKDEGQILETIPGARDPASRTVRHLQDVLALDPHNLDKALAVARADLERSRALADPRWLGRTEAVLAPWFAQNPIPTSVLLIRAIILQSNHEFASSTNDLNQVVERDPRNAQAWLVRASIGQVQARYADAIADCGQFANLTLGLAPDTCTAQVESLTGHAPLALKALTISLQQYPTEPASTRVWALTAAAEIAARLDDGSAEDRFKQALAVDADDPYLLGAWSDWLLDHDRAAEVATLLRDKTRIDPLLLRLAIAEQQLNQDAAAQHIADLAARFEASRLRGESVHRREEARFRLELMQQPDVALKLAEANWGVQREPADARILLETALAARAPAAGNPVIDWLNINRVEDRRLRTLAAQLQSVGTKG